MIQKIRELQQSEYFVQIVKFILVGILNTIFGYSLWALLLFLGMHYALAVIVSTIIAVLFNFKTTGSIVFKNRDNKLLFKFVQVYIITMCLNIFLLKIAKTAGLNLYIAGFVLTIVVAMITFLLQKFYVFRREDEKN